MNIEEQIRKLVNHPEKLRFERIEGNPFQEVRDEFAKELAERGYDAHQKRADEDWSAISQEVVPVY